MLKTRTLASRRAACSRRSRDRSGVLADSVNAGGGREDSWTLGGRNGGQAVTSRFGFGKRDIVVQ